MFYLITLPILYEYYTMLCYSYCCILINNIINNITREKKERMNDPNIEYVDMDDFRPGGKHGPKEETATTASIGSDVSSIQNNINPEIAQELRKASEVVASAIQVG